MGVASPSRVCAADLGSDWPLSVSCVTLYCDGDAVSLVYEEVRYAGNGLGEMAGYADIDPIWMPSSDPDSGGPKQSIGPLIERGLALCR